MEENTSDGDFRQIRVCHSAQGHSCASPGSSLQIQLNQAPWRLQFHIRPRVAKTAFPILRWILQSPDLAKFCYRQERQGCSLPAPQSQCRLHWRLATSSGPMGWSVSAKEAHAAASPMVTSLQQSYSLCLSLAGRGRSRNCGFSLPGYASDTRPGGGGGRNCGLCFPHASVETVSVEDRMLIVLAIAEIVRHFKRRNNDATTRDKDTSSPQLRRLGWSSLSLLILQSLLLHFLHSKQYVQHHHH